MRVLVALLVVNFIFCSLSIAQEVQSKRKKELDRLTEIVIVADPFNPSLLEHGSPVTVVDKEKLKIISESSLGETLSQEPGVSSTYFGPGASRPVIRGNSGERVKILKNGVGTLDVSNYSEDHQVTANPLAAKSIEILRGPETLLYGSQAIGGVVNVVDGQIPEKSIGKVATGTLNFKTGTADGEVTTSALVEGQASDFNWHIDSFNQDTDDIKIPGNAKSDIKQNADGENSVIDTGGRLENSYARSQGVNVGGSAVKKWGFLGMSLSDTNSIYGVPGAEKGVSINLKQVRLDLKGRVDKPFESFKSLKFNLGGSNYDHQELEGKNVGTRFSNDALEGRVELSHDTWSGWDGVFGTQQEYSDFAAIGEEAFIPATKRSASSLFVFEERKLNDLFKFQSGGRYELVSLNPANREDKNYNPYGVSAGVVLDPTSKDDYTIGLTTSYTQRAPTSPELFADGAHIARQIFEIGSSDLDQEKSTGVDLTFKKNTGLITGALNFFVQDFKDYINLSSTDRIQNDLRVFEYNNINARLYGGELEYAFHLHELLGMWVNDIDLYGQVDLVRGENKSDNGDLPRIPPVRTKVGLSYGWRDLFKAGCEAQLVSAQNHLADNELPTDSYTLLNAFVSQKLPKFSGQQLSFFIRGTNLTNDDARMHASFLKDLAPLRGRSVLFGIESNF